MAVVAAVVLSGLLSSPVYSNPMSRGSSPGIKPNAQSLFDAINSGNLRRTKTLLDEGVSVNSVSPGGLTALMCASMDNRPGIVRVLIARGADVNARLNAEGSYIDHSTALIFACGSVTNIMAGVDVPPAPKGYEQDPIAFSQKYPAVVKAYDAKLNRWLSGYRKIAGMLVDAGADVNAQAVHGDTAIVNAAGSFNTEVVAYLLNHGARLDLPVKDNDEDATTGFDALDGATSEASKNIVIVKMLLAHGANPNAVKPLATTPLGNAGRPGRPRSCEASPSGGRQNERPLHERPENAGAS